MWWKNAVFYQIYPRSFADANGDGIGDIPGITSKLDYLKWLGIDAIWLSPHYPSPQIDVGYDVADYTDVNPEYGSIADFKTFLTESHNRGIRVILDMVLNHTSDKHRWFIESKSSRDNPKRDWYVWKDPAEDGGRPNNWDSIFGGPAWEWDEATGQYYYHYFLKEQPDLNWRNPEVEKAMFDAMRFWLDLGVDGFRLDAIGTIFEDPDFPNHKSPYNAYDALKAFWLGKEMNVDPEEVSKRFQWHFGLQHDLPEIHDLMKRMRQLVDEYDARLLIGETSDLKYLGKGDDQLHAVFNFDLLGKDRLTPELIRQNQQKWLVSVPRGSWFGNTLNNHDQSRTKTHYGDGVHDAELARIAAALMLTLPGTPYLYYGEEIGMEDYAVQSFDEVRDMVAMVYRQLMREDGRSDAQILKDLATFSRDRCRTPMQWSDTPNAGFSPEGVETWLPVHENYADGVNVAAQEDDAGSLLTLFRQLIHLRKETPALLEGTYAQLDPESTDYLAFFRQTDDETCAVFLNFTPDAQPVHYRFNGVDVLFSSADRARIDTATLDLQPFEVLIVRML